MATQQQLDDCYMKTAYAHASLSKAKRLQVGATLVTKTGVTVSGVNGLPKQLGNECETAVAYSLDADSRTITEATLVTKPEVIHAELSCLLKCAKEGVSCLGGVLYTTHAPCAPCGSMLITSGVEEVVYAEEYRDSRGLRLLEQAGVRVRKYVSNK